MINIKHIQLNYGFPWGQSAHLAVTTTQYTHLDIQHIDINIKYIPVEQNHNPLFKVKIQKQTQLVDKL